MRPGGSRSSAALLADDSPWRPLVVRRERVVNEARAHFLHRHALEFMRRVRRHCPIEPGQRATAQLLGPLGRDVDEKKAAGYRYSALGFDRRSAFILEIVMNHGLWRVLETARKCYCPLRVVHV